MVQSLWKIVWKFLTNLNVHSPEHPEISLLVLNEFIPREMKAPPHKDLYANVYNSFIHDSQKTGNNQMVANR